MNFVFDSLSKASAFDFRRLVLAFAMSVGVGCGSSLVIDHDDQGTPDSAGVPSAIGELGAPCAPSGSLSCAGHAQKIRLLCDQSIWVSNGTCPGDQICDTRVGSMSGTCQEIDPVCVGKIPGEAFC